MRDKLTVTGFQLDREILVWWIPDRGHSESKTHGGERDEAERSSRVLYVRKYSLLPAYTAARIDGSQYIAARRIGPNKMGQAD